MNRTWIKLISIIVGLEMMATGQELPTQECQHSLTGETGSFTSTNFESGAYPPNHHCSWKISVQPGRIVRLVFRYFQFERGSYCQNDKVSVYNGPSEDYPLLGRFCGAFRPGALASTSNQIYVTMDTDSSTQKQGFYAYYEEETSFLATEDSCGGLLNSSTGTFHSPRYQLSEYPPSASCSWHIKVPGSTNIRVSFKDFDIEKSRGCKYDAVIFNKDSDLDPNSRVVERYCGQIESLPQEISSRGDELFITFVSDSSGFGRGFVANYIADMSPRKADTNERSSTTTTTAATSTTTSLTSTTTPTTPTSTQSTTFIQSSRPAFECPKKCTKVKAKARICSTNYVAAVRIPRTDAILRGEQSAVEVIETFKVDSFSRHASISFQLLCPSCHKLRRPGTYLVIGNLEDNVLVMRPGDFVTKYKSKKHPKIIPKWTKKCGRRRRRRRRRGHNRI